MLSPEDVAQAIKKLRGSRTQKEVAELGGVDRPTWCGYEGGKAMPKGENLSKIALGLGCTPRELDEAIMVEWRRRIAAESATAAHQHRPGAASSPPTSTPAEGAVLEHLHELIRHLYALFCLVPQETGALAAGPPPPRADRRAEQPRNAGEGSS